MHVFNAARKKLYIISITGGVTWVFWNAFIMDQGYTYNNKKNQSEFILV